MQTGGKAKIGMLRGMRGAVLRTEVYSRMEASQTADTEGTTPQREEQTGIVARFQRFPLNSAKVRKLFRRSVPERVVGGKGKGEEKTHTEREREREGWGWGWGVQKKTTDRE